MLDLFAGLTKLSSAWCSLCSFPNDLKGFFSPSVLSYGFLCILRTYNKYSVWCTDELLINLVNEHYFRLFL